MPDFFSEKKKKKTKLRHSEPFGLIYLSFIDNLVDFLVSWGQEGDPTQMGARKERGLACGHQVGPHHCLPRAGSGLDWVKMEKPPLENLLI